MKASTTETTLFCWKTYAFLVFAKIKVALHPSIDNVGDGI